MEVSEIVKVQDPTTGRVIKVFLSEEESISLLTFALTHLVTLGAASLVTEKDGMNIHDLQMDTDEVAN